MTTAWKQQKVLRYALSLFFFSLFLYSSFFVSIMKTGAEMKREGQSITMIEHQLAEREQRYFQEVQKLRAEHFSSDVPNHSSEVVVAYTRLGENTRLVYTGS